MDAEQCCECKEKFPSSCIKKCNSCRHVWCFCCIENCTPFRVYAHEGERCNQCDPHRPHFDKSSFVSWILSRFSPQEMKALKTEYMDDLTPEPIMCGANCGYGGEDCDAIDRTYVDKKTGKDLGIGICCCCLYEEDYTTEKMCNLCTKRWREMKKESSVKKTKFTDQKGVYGLCANCGTPVDQECDCDDSVNRSEDEENNHE